MIATASLDDILDTIDYLEPLRSCQEIGSELTLAVQSLMDQGREAEAQQLEYERQACLLTVRAVVLVSARPRRTENDLEDRIVGLIGYSDGSQWPDPATFKVEMFEYLFHRAENTANPVLKARYHDLVFEKSELPRKHISGLAAVDAYLAAAQRFSEAGEHRYQLEMISDMDHAAYLALKLGDHGKVAAVVQLLVTLIEHEAVRKSVQKSNGKDYPVGRWVLELAWLLLSVREHRRFGRLVTDAYLNRVKVLVSDLAQANVEAGHGHIEGQYLQIASRAAELLQENQDKYGFKLRRAESLVRRGDESQQQEGNGPRHLIAAHFYEEAVLRYQQLRAWPTVTKEQRKDIDRRENALRVLIRQMYREGRSEFGRIEIPLEVSREDLEQMLAYFLAPETLEECLNRIVTKGSLLPDPQQAEDVALKEQNQVSLISLLSQRRIQNHITVSVAETQLQKLSQQIHDNLLRWIQISSSLILCELFSRLQTQKGLNAGKLTAYLIKSRVFDEDNLVIIERGLEHYFEEDYISALHILVPQFEDVLRTAFEQGGQGVIQPRMKESGWEVETFGKFLSHSLVKATLPPELLIYIQLVMTEQTGWNLRNRVAHGLIRPQDCNVVTVATVLHLFLLLTLLQVEDRVK